MDKTNFSEIELDRIIEMAWEDRTPFEAITFQFGISEQQTIEIMRSEMKRSVSICGENGFKVEQQNMQNLGQME